MSKEIDINNEEEILKECDFAYFYESENCSRELCMFYNDIRLQNADYFNCKQAHIDLGRIAITLNKQAQRIAELEDQLAEKDKEIEELKDYIGCKGCIDLIAKTHQDKISFAVEQLEKVRELAEKEIKECNKLLQEEFEDDYYIQSVNARQSMCYEFRREINDRIEQLKGVK